MAERSRHSKLSRHKFDLSNDRSTEFRLPVDRPNFQNSHKFYLFKWKRGIYNSINLISQKVALNREYEEIT